MSTIDLGTCWAHMSTPFSVEDLAKTMAEFTERQTRAQAEFFKELHRTCGACEPGMPWEGCPCPRCPCKACKKWAEANTWSIADLDSWADQVLHESTLMSALWHIRNGARIVTDPDLEPGTMCGLTSQPGIVYASQDVVDRLKAHLLNDVGQALEAYSPIKRQ